MFSRHRMGLLLKQPFVALVDQYGCLEILTGPARAVTTDYGRFTYGCSQACKASARARTVPTRAPYETRRVDVRIPTIPKNTDNPKNARMHVTMHIEKLTSYGLPKGHRPVRLPMSYGPKPLVGITRCCDHMHTGVLWVICVFVGHVVARYHTCTLPVPKGAPVDSIWTWRHPYVQFCGNRTVPCGCRAGLGIPVRSVVQGLTVSGEARQCTLGL